MNDCFVVMGYGKKMDYQLGKTIDLDSIYNRVIKPALSRIEGIKSIRGDEISNSEIIDKDMFELLLSSDIVIADITTLNPNAIYELGVRHALKPYSTIITGIDEVSIPFDFNHNRVFHYSLSDINNDEKIYDIIISLEKIIRNTMVNINSKNNRSDSPIYEFIDGVIEPKISYEKIQKIKNKHYKAENTISRLNEKAHHFIHEEKYLEASEIFKQLAENTNNDYYVQQRALFLKKDGKLEEADRVIKKLNPLKSMDTETTGIYGATHKKLYEKTKYYNHLDIAIRSYLRGFILKNDYYNGDNVVNCLILKYLNNKDLSNDEKIALKITISKFNEEVLKSANEAIKNNRNNGKEDKWAYSTAATAYLLKNNINDYNFNRDHFINNSSEKWEVETFEDTEAIINEYKDKVNKN